MAEAWLALGANIGEPRRQVEAAIERLEAVPGLLVTARSGLIVTAPWGKTDQPDFVNAVIAVSTTLTPRALLEACLRVEAEMGRERKERWGPRLIDIDVIAYDRLVLAEHGLVLPHPHAHERDFVLGPLREIAPDVAAWIVARAPAR